MIKFLTVLGIGIISVICLIALVAILGIIIGGILIPVELFIAWIESIRDNSKK